jgi:hypothetical protein
VLEISVPDIPVFEDLLPDEWMKTSGAERPSQAERLERFASDKLKIVADDETTLRAELVLIDSRLRKERASPFAGMINPTTGRRAPESPKDKRVIYAELEYPFSGKPRSLTFVPPLGKRGNAAVVIGFIAYHKVVPIIDFRYLSRAAKVNLDWQDPWYSKFDNPNLKRHHKSALMSYLYVEPREVRHEVLIRVRDLEEWTDLGLSGGEIITTEEQSRIKERASAFLAKRNPMKIDDADVAPDSARAEFLKVTLKGLQVVEEENFLELSTAIIGVILSYHVIHLPNKVTVEWDMFNENVRRIPATATDPAGPFLTYLEAKDPTHKWENYLLKYKDLNVSPVLLDDGRSIGIPMLSLVFLILALCATLLTARPVPLSRRVTTVTAAAFVLAAVLTVKVFVIEITNPFAGPPDKAISTKIVANILNNVNRAFLVKDQSALKNALSVVVAENTLKDVEAELGRSLAIKVAGGGIARVDAVKDLKLREISSLEGRSGFSSLAEWTATASAGHWGHPHRRTMRFQALMEIVNIKGVWKLAGITIVDARQQT